MLDALVILTACAARPTSSGGGAVVPTPMMTTGITALSSTAANAPVAPVDARHPRAENVASATGGTYSVAIREFGIIRPFEDGAQVLTSGPFVLQIRFSPYPPADRSDLEVTVADAETCRPIEGEQVSVRADMPSHGHTITAIRLTDRGTGRHGTSINQLMGGD
jgi:hypothetical protein